jgi:hypothetical protein
MIKKVEYDLNYRIKGKKSTKKIEIDFVPNQRHEDYSKIQQEMFDIRAAWMNIQAIEEEIRILKETKPEDFNMSIKVFKEEINKLEDLIRASKSSNLIERRFELLKDILEDNGYSEDADLMSWKFWNNSVNPHDINELLELCIWKDIDKKKAVH